MFHVQEMKLHNLDLHWFTQNVRLEKEGVEVLAEVYPHSHHRLPFYVISDFQVFFFFFF